MFFGMMILAIAVMAAGRCGNGGGNGGPVNKEVLQQSLARALQGSQISCAFNVDYDSNSAAYAYTGSTISVADKKASNVSPILNNVSEQYPSVSIRPLYSYVDLSGNEYSTLGALNITQLGQAEGGTLSLRLIVLSFDSSGASSTMFTETVISGTTAILFFCRSIDCRGLSGRCDLGVQQFN